MVVDTHLKADGDVLPAAEGGGDGAGRESQGREQRGKRGAERDARPLLRHHHQGAHAPQLNAARPQLGHRAAQAACAKLHHTWQNFNIYYRP